MTKITRDTVIGDILGLDQSTAPFFLEVGMYCLDCPASRRESTQEVCMVHGANPDAPAEELNVHLGAR